MRVLYILYGLGIKVRYKLVAGLRLRTTSLVCTIKGEHIYLSNVLISNPVIQSGNCDCVRV